MKSNTYAEHIDTLKQELQEVWHEIEAVRGDISVGACIDRELELYQELCELHRERIAIEEEVFLLLESEEAAEVAQEKFSAVVGDSTTYHEVKERLGR